MRHNSWKRKALALMSVPALAVPSAIGVERYLEPESGAVAAWAAAVGFEILYVGVNILILRSPELRRYARNVSLAAVATAVLLNSLAHYRANVPLAYSGAVFNALAAVLALVASLPLAGLAYAVSVLLHRLSEDEAHALDVLSDALNTPPPPVVTVSGPERPALPEQAPQALTTSGDERTSLQRTKMRRVAHPAQINANDRKCPKCGIELEQARWLAARRWGHCEQCKEVA